ADRDRARLRPAPRGTGPGPAAKGLEVVAEAELGDRVALEALLIRRAPHEVPADRREVAAADEDSGAHGADALVEAAEPGPRRVREQCAADGGERPRGRDREGEPADQREAHLLLDQHGAHAEQRPPVVAPHRAPSTEIEPLGIA